MKIMRVYLKSGQCITGEITERAEPGIMEQLKSAWIKITGSVGTVIIPTSEIQYIEIHQGE